MFFRTNASYGDGGVKARVLRAHLLMHNSKFCSIEGAYCRICTPAQVLSWWGQHSTTDEATARGGTRKLAFGRRIKCKEAHVSNRFVSGWKLVFLLSSCFFRLKSLSENQVYLVGSYSLKLTDRGTHLWKREQQKSSITTAAETNSLEMADGQNSSSYG